MNDIMTINDHNLQVKEYQGQRVVTLPEIDMVHERPAGTARRNFGVNKSHLLEGVDYFVANQPDEIRSLGLTRTQGGTPASVTLLTQSGYLMLVKSFTDDLAWDVQRDLVNHYFSVAHKASRKNNDDAKPLREAAMLLNATTKAARLVSDAMKAAGVAPTYQVLTLKGIYSKVGINIPTDGLTVSEKTYDATTIAKRLGIMSANGKPHGQAVAAIIRVVGVQEGESIRVPCVGSSGHADSNLQYTQAVIDRVLEWLRKRNYPTPIVTDKKYHVVYEEV